MLSRWKDQIEFRVNPISCSTGGADLWDHLRVAANTWILFNTYYIFEQIFFIFYFSYTSKGLELDGKIGYRSKVNADPLYNSTYARQCNICEERIYFSHPTAVDDYQHRRDPIFRIGKSEGYGDKFAWIEHSGFFSHFLKTFLFLIDGLTSDTLTSKLNIMNNMQIERISPIGIENFNASTTLLEIHFALLTCVYCMGQKSMEKNPSSIALTAFFK